MLLNGRVICYSTVEGESLAVADALDKARYLICADHKHLLKILGDRSLGEISNSHLRNLQEKTLRYRFRMIHVPGIKHCAADGISRYSTSDVEHMQLPDDIAAISPNADVDVPPLPRLSSLSSNRTPDMDIIDKCIKSSITSSFDSFALQ